MTLTLFAIGTDGVIGSQKCARNETREAFFVAKMQFCITNSFKIGEWCYRHPYLGWFFKLRLGLHVLFSFFAFRLFFYRDDRMNRFWHDQGCIPFGNLYVEFLHEFLHYDVTFSVYDKLCLFVHFGFGEVDDDGVFGVGWQFVGRLDLERRAQHDAQAGGPTVRARV